MRVAVLFVCAAVLLALPFLVTSKGMARSVYVADVAHTSIYHFGLATNTSRTVVDNSGLQGDHGLCGLAFSRDSHTSSVLLLLTCMKAHNRGRSIGVIRTTKVEPSGTRPSMALLLPSS